MAKLLTKTETFVQLQTYNFFTHLVSQRKGFEKMMMTRLTDCPSKVMVRFWDPAFPSDDSDTSAMARSELKTQLQIYLWVLLTLLGKSIIWATDDEKYWWSNISLMQVFILAQGQLCPDVDILTDFRVLCEWKETYVYSILELCKVYKAAFSFFNSFFSFLEL